MGDKRATYENFNTNILIVSTHVFMMKPKSEFSFHKETNSFRFIRIGHLYISHHIGAILCNSVTFIKVMKPEELLI